MRNTYNTLIYNPKKLFIYLLITLISLILLLILIVVQLKLSPLIAAIGGGILFIAPFLFEKRIKRRFTKRCLLVFDQDSFSITKSHLESEIISTKLIIPWNDIQSYNVYFSPAKNTLFTVYLSNGKSYAWNFKDDKTLEEAIQGESAFNMFHTFIRQHNKSKGNKIILRPGYLTTKSGGTVLYSIMILIVTAFIVHIIKQPKTSFVSLLMGFSILVQLFIKRRDEKVLYNKIEQLDEAIDLN